MTTMAAMIARAHLQVFDPKQDVLIVERRLPHWSQAGTLSFITWRTWDSIPKSVLNRWLGERCEFLKRYGIDPRASNWAQQLQQLPLEAQEVFQHTFAKALEQFPRCVPRRLRLALAGVGQNRCRQSASL